LDQKPSVEQTLYTAAKNTVYSGVSLVSMHWIGNAYCSYWQQHELVISKWRYCQCSASSKRKDFISLLVLLIFSAIFFSYILIARKASNRPAMSI